MDMAAILAMWQKQFVHILKSLYMKFDFKWLNAF